MIVHSDRLCIFRYGRKTAGRWQAKAPQQIKTPYIKEVPGYLAVKPARSFF
jgi:hypothetical protein